MVDGLPYGNFPFTYLTMHYELEISLLTYEEDESFQHQHLQQAQLLDI